MRGAGTGNYGQAMPLSGGVVLNLEGPELNLLELALLNPQVLKREVLEPEMQ